MALILSTETEYGVYADYWRIIQVEFFLEERRCQFTLALYKDEDTRRRNKKPLGYRQVVWEGDDFPLSIENMKKFDPLKILYQKLKLDTDFEEASDAD